MNTRIDYHRHRHFFNWLLQTTSNLDPVFFLVKIIIFNEAHFTLDGFINKQNCHIGEPENPHW